MLMNGNDINPGMDRDPHYHSVPRRVQSVVSHPEHVLNVIEMRRLIELLSA